MLKKISCLLALLLIFLTSAPSSVAQNENKEESVVQVCGFDYSENQKSYIGYGCGSGVILDSQGTLVTNAHVVLDKLDEPLDYFDICIQKENNEGSECTKAADLLNYDEDLDLAILRLQEKDFLGNPVSVDSFISESSFHTEVEMGEQVSVLGFPSNGNNTISLTKGIISGFSQVDNRDFYKTDADIDFGNSGGGAFDSDNKFIGVPSFAIKGLSASGYIIPAGVVQNFYKDHKADPIISDINPRDNGFNQRVDLLFAEKSDEIKFRGLTLKIPENWELKRMKNDFSLTLEIKDEEKKDEEKEIISIELSYFHKSPDIDLLADLVDQQLKLIFPAIESVSGDRLTNLPGEEYREINYEIINHKMKLVLVKNGNFVVAFTIGVKENDWAYAKTLAEDFFTNVRLTELPKKYLKEVSLIDPGVTFSLPDNFFFAQSGDGAELLYRDVNKKSRAGDISINHDKNIKSLADLRDAYYSYLNPEVNTAIGILKSTYKTTAKGDRYYFLNYRDNKRGKIYYMSNFFYDGKSFSIDFIFDLDDEKNPDVIGEFESSFEQLNNSVEFGSVDSTFFDNFPIPTQNLVAGTESSTEESSNNTTTDTEADPFLADAYRSQFQKAIIGLKEKGVINGYPDGSFKPFNLINRAEFMKIIIGAAGITPGGKNCFSDVQEEWYAPYVCAGRANGLINGYPDGSFQPTKKINVAEAIKIALKAFDIGVREAGAEEVWYQPFIEYAQQQGYYLNTFDAASYKLTREDMAELVYRLMP